jgi:hypothetical protein
MGGGRFFPGGAGAVPAPAAGAGAGRVAAGSGADDGGTSATGSCRALKLRFLRIGVAMRAGRGNVKTCKDWKARQR